MLAMWNIVQMAAMAAGVRVSVPSSVAMAGAPRQMTTMSASMSKAEAAEEARWRVWFWEQAEEAIDERFGSASKRELKRVREFIRFNRDDEPLPKKLRKNPHYDVIGGYFPGLTTTNFHEKNPWEDALVNAYPSIKQEVELLLKREQVSASNRRMRHYHRTMPHRAKLRQPSGRGSAACTSCLAFTCGRLRAQEFLDVGKPLGWRTMPIYDKGELHPDFPTELCPATMGVLKQLREVTRMEVL